MTLVRYHSQEHGNTQAMAEAVAEGAREAGAKIKLVNTNEHRFDPNQYRKTAAELHSCRELGEKLAGAA